MGMITADLSAQGLFEEAGSAAGGGAFPFRLNGYGRAVMYLGDYVPPENSEIRSAYGEAALRLSASGGSRASFYSELRFRDGYEYNDWIRDFSLREAYVDLALGKFELRAGKAVVAWGRADVINPTNNLTPQDYFVRSPEPGDMRLGNFLLRGRLNLSPSIRLEGVWVPRYRYSVYRYDLFEMPSYVRFQASPLPAAALKNGSVGAKIDFFFDRIDGSLSWFNGFDPMPGIQPGELPGTVSGSFHLDMYARAFRQQTLGLDFSCGLGSFGVRGEAALKDPSAAYRNQVFAPNRDLQYVLEVERSFGNLTLMVLYSGRYVFDFEQGMVTGSIPEIDPGLLQNPENLALIGPMLEQRVAAFNRILFSQTHEVTHVLGFRPALSMFHGIGKAEVFGMANLSTREWSLHPKVTWSASDNLKLSLGGEVFAGPDNTLFNLIAPVFKGGYFEMKYSF